jgi:hypothetical protein
MKRPANPLLAVGLVGVLVSAAAVAGGPRSGRAHPPGAGAPEYRTYFDARPVEARPRPADPDPRPLVWVVDGAGDLKGCSKALSHANLLAGSTIELTVFPWSHGYRKLLLDQTDWPHARAQGERLAAAILDRKAREPNRRVVVVAHSAGCAVALAAGAYLPADSLDRTILLAPSVSAGYDLRPSLAAAREGVDVFCSRKDRVALGFVVRVVGTADRGSGGAAGRFGFNPTAPDANAKLRQHFWSADQKWTGHTGGHHGMHAPAFVHAYLFPLIGAPVR